MIRIAICAVAASSAAALLIACSQSVMTDQTGQQVTVAKKLAEPAQLNGAAVAEVCYDGVVYLLTPQGGISPKINKHNAAALSGTIGSQHPFILCGK